MIAPQCILKHKFSKNHSVGKLTAIWNSHFSCLLAGGCLPSFPSLSHCSILLLSSLASGSVISCPCPYTYFTLCRWLSSFPFLLITSFNESIPISLCRWLPSLPRARRRGRLRLTRWQSFDGVHARPRRRDGQTDSLPADDRRQSQIGQEEEGQGSKEQTQVRLLPVLELVGLFL